MFNNVITNIININYWNGKKETLYLLLYDGVYK